MPTPGQVTGDRGQVAGDRGQATSKADSAVRDPGGGLGGPRSVNPSKADSAVRNPGGGLGGPRSVNRIEGGLGGPRSRKTTHRNSESGEISDVRSPMSVLRCPLSDAPGSRAWHRGYNFTTLRSTPNRSRPLKYKTYLTLLGLLAACASSEPLEGAYQTENGSASDESDGTESADLSFDSLSLDVDGDANVAGDSTVVSETAGGDVDASTELDASTGDRSSADGSSGQIAITTSLESCLVVGEPVSVALRAEGASVDARWSATGLPPGVELSATGILSGDAETPGDYDIVIQVVDGGRVGDRLYPTTVAPELLLAIGPVPGYIEGRPAGNDILAQAIAGETEGTRCNLYYTDGAGGFVPGITRPETDPTRCTIVGDATTEEHPGIYGVLVEVIGECDQKQYVPVRYEGRSCSDGAAVLTSSHENHVHSVDEEYTFHFEINDVDRCQMQGDTCNCEGCSLIGLEAAPLTVLEEYVCEGADVCLESCTDEAPCWTTGTGCPSTFTYARTVLTKAHEFVGPDESAAAWVTYETTVVYSGDNRNIESCGDKQWTCHLDVLELR